MLFQAVSVLFIVISEPICMPGQVWVVTMHHAAALYVFVACGATCNALDSSIRLAGSQELRVDSNGICFHLVEVRSRQRQQDCRCVALNGASTRRQSLPAG